MSWGLHRVMPFAPPTTVMISDMREGPPPPYPSDRRRGDDHILCTNQAGYVMPPQGPCKSWPAGVKKSRNWPKS